MGLGHILTYQFSLWIFGQVQAFPTPLRISYDATTSQCTVIITQFEFFPVLLAASICLQVLLPFGLAKMEPLSGQKINISDN